MVLVAQLAVQLVQRLVERLAEVELLAVLAVQLVRRRHLSQKRKFDLVEVEVEVQGLLPKVAVPIRLLLHCRWLLLSR